MNSNMNSNMISMRSQPAHRCPICAGNMRFDSVLAITFADGGRDHVLKYACTGCHVEMSRTEKAPLVRGRERSRPVSRAGNRAA